MDRETLRNKPTNETDTTTQLKINKCRDTKCCQAALPFTFYCKQHILKELTQKIYKNNKLENAEKLAQNFGVNNNQIINNSPVLLSSGNNFEPECWIFTDLLEPKQLPSSGCKKMITRSQSQVTITEEAPIPSPIPLDDEDFDPEFYNSLKVLSKQLEHHKTLKINFQHFNDTASNFSLPESLNSSDQFSDVANQLSLKMLTFDFGEKTRNFVSQKLEKSDFSSQVTCEIDFPDIFQAEQEILEQAQIDSAVMESDSEIPYTNDLSESREPDAIIKNPYLQDQSSVRSRNKSETHSNDFDPELKMALMNEDSNSTFGHKITGTNSVISGKSFEKDRVLSPSFSDKKDIYRPETPNSGISDISSTGSGTLGDPSVPGITSGRNTHNSNHSGNSSLYNFGINVNYSQNFVNTVDQVYSQFEIDNQSVTFGSETINLLTDDKNNSIQSQIICELEPELAKFAMRDTMSKSTSKNLASNRYKNSSNSNLQSSYDQFINSKNAKKRKLKGSIETGVSSPVPFGQHPLDRRSETPPIQLLGNPNSYNFEQNSKYPFMYKNPQNWGQGGNLVTTGSNVSYGSPGNLNQNTNNSSSSSHRYPKIQKLDRSDNKSVKSSKKSKHEVSTTKLSDFFHNDMENKQKEISKSLKAKKLEKRNKEKEKLKGRTRDLPFRAVMQNEGLKFGKQTLRQSKSIFKDLGPSVMIFQAVSKFEKIPRHPEFFFLSTNC